MKKILVVALFLTIAAITVGCNKNYKVNFMVEGEVHQTLESKGNETIVLPQDPSVEDGVFIGWFWKNDGMETPFTSESLANISLTSDIEVYAKWHFHNFKEVVTPATCEEDGYVSYICACQAVSDEITPIPATGHDYGKWISNSDGTHTKSCENDSSHQITDDCYGGSATCIKQAICDDCLSGYGELLNHEYATEWSVTDDNHWHQCATPKCTSKEDYEEHDFDSNKKCIVCEYVTTRLLGVEIATTVYTVEGDNLFVKVPNDQESFDFSDTIEVAREAEYKVYWANGNNLIDNFIATDLQVGNNTFYIVVSNGELSPKTYPVIVRRRPTYTVTFVIEGSEIGTQTVEEDDFAQTPITKEGYALICDFDLSLPITEEKTINATWEPNLNTIRFDGNGIDIGMQPIQGRTDETIALPKFDFVTTDCVFLGWATSADGDIQYLDEDLYQVGTAGEQVLYALWLLQTESGFSWSLINGVATIFEYFGNDTEVVIPSTLAGVDVTFIGEIFDEDSNLTSLTVPFVGTMSDGAGCFGHIFGASSEQENSIYVPASLKTVVVTGGNMIGNAAFQDCANIISISILDGVTSIGEGAFSGCTSLYSITIPDSVTSIGEGAFSGCASLYSISIPDSVTSIGEGAFTNCTGLNSVIIGNGITSIQHMTFVNCTSLTSVSLPNTLTKIGTYAFAYSGLPSISLPDSLTIIDDHAFVHCTNLTSITIPDSVTSIGKSAFRYCSGLNSAIIGNGVTSIGEWAFAYTGLTSVIIGNSLATIGSYVFANCANLKTITIPDNVTKIETYAFSGCHKLTNVTIGIGVTSIEQAAFLECIELRTINYTGTVAQWNSISLEKNWMVNIKKVICLDGEVEIKY